MPSPNPWFAPVWDDPTKASTLSRHFVVAFPETYSYSQRVGARQLLVRSTLDTTVEVHQPAARLGWAAEYAETVHVTAGLTHIELPEVEWLRPTWVWPPPYREADVSSAFVVESEAPVEVLAFWEPDEGRTDLPAESAISRILPMEELGTRYVVVSPAPSSVPEWFFAVHVVAVANDTLVTAALVEEEFRLDAGQVARIRLFPEDITSERSWLVTADKPVAVFTGGGPRCNEGGWRSLGYSWEQVPPVTRWGTEYVALPVYGAQATDLVVVSDLGSSVQLNCGPALPVLPGDVLRVPLEGPTRVTSIGPPVQALVEVGAHECDLIDASEPAVAALTPQALGRTTSVLEPVEQTTHPSFVDAGWVLTTLASVAGGAALGDGSDPPLMPAEVSSVGDVHVEVLEVDQASSLREGDGFRGIDYGILPVGEVVDPHVLGYPLPPLATYATHLGYDCVGCLPALTSEPVCP